jgi:hypothetical protein
MQPREGFYDNGFIVVFRSNLISCNGVASALRTRRLILPVALR